jgi:hypothetical protein
MATAVQYILSRPDYENDAGSITYFLPVDSQSVKSWLNLIKL